MVDLLGGYRPRVFCRGILSGVECWIRAGWYGRWLGGI